MDLAEGDCLRPGPIFAHFQLVNILEQHIEEDQLFSPSLKDRALPPAQPPDPFGPRRWPSQDRPATFKELFHGGCAGA